MSACYARLDDYEMLLCNKQDWERHQEAISHFLSECSTAATTLASHSLDLSNLERARLLDIVLRASDLGRHVRRSTRERLCIRLRLRNIKSGNDWMEETDTREVSRYGAAVLCQHRVQIGDKLLVTRLETGQEALARVVWREHTQGGDLNVGIEFLESNNFWDLAWNSAIASL